MLEKYAENGVNEYLRLLADDDLDGYMTFNQTEFLKRLERFRVHIDEFTYKRLCAESYDGNSWCEAIDHFKQITDVLCMAVLDNGRNSILSRMKKGAEMIERERDPVKKRQFIALYDSLELELNKLSGA